MIITIDGPAGTGKSTVAKEVARKLGFVHFDTGAMYRCLAWKVLRSGIDPLESQEVVKLVQNFQFEIKTAEDGTKAYFVDHVDVTQAIRTPEVTQTSSMIAVYPEVRCCIVKITRRFGRSCNAVFEGRDMGTVVFPKADVKIFLQADSQVRALRRYKELMVKFPDLSDKKSLEEILQEMQQRDEIDSTREASPLVKAVDATLIDTSFLTIEQVVKKIISLVPVSVAKMPKMSFFYRFIHYLSALFFRRFFHFNVYRSEKIFPGGGILIANHGSLYDPFVIAVSLNDEVNFVTRNNFFERAFLRKFVKDLNTHTFGEKETELKKIKNMLKWLDEGKKILVFPEGKRLLSEHMDVFEKKIVLLAKKAKCPVYPIYLHGVDQAWPEHRSLPKFFSKISVVFGQGVYFDEFEDLPEKLAEEKFLEKCREQIIESQMFFESI